MLLMSICMQSNKKIKVRKSGTLNSDSNGEFNVRWLNGASVHCCRYNIFMHIINHSCNQNIWKVWRRKWVEKMGVWVSAGRESDVKSWEVSLWGRRKWSGTSWIENKFHLLWRQFQSKRGGLQLIQTWYQKHQKTLKQKKLWLEVTK